MISCRIPLILASVPFAPLALAAPVSADLTGPWRATAAATVSAVVQNVMDDKHREFVGVPEIGRLGLLGITQTL